MAGVVVGITITARHAELLRRQRHALGMVAGRGADHAALALRRRQVGDLVVGAAQLEAEHRLHVLALEQMRLPMRAERMAPAPAAFRWPRHRRGR
jgi:hypothetical protein